MVAQSNESAKANGRKTLRHWFHLFACKTADLMGTPWAFLTGVVIIVVWTLTGPVFGYSDSWQLVINTGTTIITFLMVFLIQNTQNRETKTLQLKLDELIRAVKGARNQLINLENMSDEELTRIKNEFEKISRRRAEVRQGLPQEKKDESNQGRRS
jgi:low affinity Fe/Cu permease